MRSGFKGFSGFGFAQAMMAMAFAASFIKPSKIQAVERRQGSRLNITRDGWKVYCHKAEAKRIWNLTPFINEYNANPMNFLPGRIASKLYRLDEKTMLRAARDKLAEMKKANPNMRISTYGSHAPTTR